MKKTILLLLSFVLAMGMFVACGQGGAGAINGVANGSGELPAVQQGNLLEIITPDALRYIEGDVFNYCRIFNISSVTIQLDDGTRISFRTSFYSGVDFLYRAYGADIDGFYVGRDNRRIGVYYTGEIVGEDTSNMQPYLYSAVDDNLERGSLAQVLIEDIENRIARMPQIEIRNFEEAIQAVIKICGYTGMQRYTIPNGNIYYTNGEYWVYSSPFVERHASGDSTPEYGINFKVDVINTPCTTEADIMAATYTQRYSVMMETGEILYF